MDAKIVNIFGFHKILTRHFIEKFLFTAIYLTIYLFWPYVQLFINLVSGLIESGAEEHEQVADFEHGIVFYCTTANFMESGGVHVYLRFVGDVYVGLAAELATAHRMQWHTVHRACRLIILVNQSFNLTMLNKLLDLGVVSAFAGGIFEDTRFETGAFDDYSPSFIIPNPSKVQ